MTDSQNAESPTTSHADRGPVRSRDELLAVAGLDLTFVRAEGDTLHTADGRAVHDFVGGFGSTLLGHNHPELVKVAREHLGAAAPVLVQGSRRAPAEELRAALAARLERETGDAYEVLLLNTGTEATEAALKHARLAYVGRLQAFAASQRRELGRLRRAIEQGRVHFDIAAWRHFEQALGIAPIRSIESLGAALLQANRPALARPGTLIAVEGGFHGKTLGSLGITWNPEARRPFFSEDPPVVFLRADGNETAAQLAARCTVPLRRLDARRRRIVEEPFLAAVAVVAEPIRGEGGIVPVEPELVATIRALCEAHPELPVIVDEIQSGLGRSGEFLASGPAGLPAHILTFGKALGGGIAKVSAVAVRRDRFIPEFTLLHSSTFAEDELSSRIARRALELIDEQDVPRRAREAGERLLTELSALAARHPEVIAEVRGRGLMIGVELRDFADSPSNALRGLTAEQAITLAVAAFLLQAHGVRVLPTLGRRSTLRLEPSAFVTEDAIAALIAGLDEACRALEQADAGFLARFLVQEPGQAAGRAVRDYRARRVEDSPRGQVRSRVAFLGHFIAARDFARWDPSFESYSDAELERLIPRMGRLLGPQVYATRVITSATGAETELSFIGLCVASTQVERDLRRRRGAHTRALAHRGYELAAELGCATVGFGGFTSIVTRGCLDFDGDGPAVTSGNALTVAMGHEAILRSLGELGIDAASSRAAVCGATGNMGRVHARLLAAEVGSLELVGRAGSRGRLRTVAADLLAELLQEPTQGREGGALSARVAAAVDALGGPDALPPDRRDALTAVEEQLGEELVRCSESPEGLREASIILTATNAADPIIAADQLGEGPVLICDLAVPGDCAEDIAAKRPDVRVIRGGVVRLPGAPDFEIPGIPLEPGQAFACMGETILLGLAGIGVDFSRGAISSARIREIAALAKLHGIALDADKRASSL